MPGSHIPNPGSSIQEEVTERGVQKFSTLKRNRVPDMGGKCCVKKQSPHFLWTLFFSRAGKKQSPQKVRTLFFHSISPHVWDSVCFRAEIFGLLSPSLPLVCWSQGLMTLGNSLGQIFPDNHCRLSTVYTKVSAP